jgi:hypothetical protein
VSHNPPAANAGALFAALHFEFYHIARAQLIYLERLGILCSCCPDQGLTQYFRIMSGKAQSARENSGFVASTRVCRIEHIVAQFAKIDNRALGIW